MEAEYDRPMVRDLPESGLGYPGTDLRRRLVEAASEIDLDFARDEGEGFESVEDWRAAHERFFERSIEPDTMIEAVRFGTVERL
jgi:ASCH domain